MESAPSGIPSLLCSIALGQLVSLMDTLSSLCVKLLAGEAGTQFPILQYVITYFIVCCVAIVPYLMLPKEPNAPYEPVKGTSKGETVELTSWDKTPPLRDVGLSLGNGERSCGGSDVSTAPSDATGMLFVAGNLNHGNTSPTVSAAASPPRFPLAWDNLGPMVPNSPNGLHLINVDSSSTGASFLSSRWSRDTSPQASPLSDPSPREVQDAWAVRLQSSHLQSPNLESPNLQSVDLEASGHNAGPADLSRAPTDTKLCPPSSQQSTTPLHPYTDHAQVNAQVNSFQSDPNPLVTSSLSDFPTLPHDVHPIGRKFSFDWAPSHDDNADLHHHPRKYSKKQKLKPFNQSKINGFQPLSRTTSVSSSDSDEGITIRDLQLKENPSGWISSLNAHRNRAADWLWKFFAVGTPAFYILVAFLDVQGGTLTVVAFNYANLASCCLIDWVSLLTAFVLSVKFMGEKATKSHIVALLVGLAGSLCILISDSMVQDSLPDVPVAGDLAAVTQKGLIPPAVQPIEMPANVDNSRLTDNSRFSNTDNSRVTDTVDQALEEAYRANPVESANRNLIESWENLAAILETSEATSEATSGGVASDSTERRNLERKLEEMKQDRRILQSQLSPLKISRSDQLFGDTMCLLAAAFLGIVTVMMENALDSGIAASEVLFKTFCPAFFIGVIEFLFLEAPRISELVAFTPLSWVYITCAALAMAGAYSLSPIVLKRCSSAFFNLSLLSSAGLAVVLSAVLLGDPFPPLYSVGLVSILSSLVIYHN